MTISQKQYEAIQAKELKWWQNYPYKPEPSWKHYTAHFAPYFEPFEIVGDIGCGPVPYIFNPIVGQETTWEAAWAIDPLIFKYSHIAKYRKWWKHKQICCTTDTGDIQDDYFDAVFALNVLDHVMDPKIMLLEIVRVLKPGGRLFLMVDIDRPPDAMHPHKIDSGWLLEQLVESYDVLMFKEEKSWKFKSQVAWFVGNLKSSGGEE